MLATTRGQKGLKPRVTSTRLIERRTVMLRANSGPYLLLPPAIRRVENALEHSTR